MDGAVIRLPGTGTGVARLVLVSMVKVDMAAASSRAALQQPVLRYPRFIDNKCNINRRASSDMQVRANSLADRSELKMANRKWLGDVGLAVLLALPTAALTRPAAASSSAHAPAAAPASVHVALSDRSTMQQRFSLPG